MMRYLFDTGACAALIADASPALLAWLRRHRPQDIGVPVPAAFGLSCGAFSSGGPSLDLAVIDGMGLEIVPFDAGDARAAGAIQGELEAKGAALGGHDVLIAGQARARDLVLVTAKVGAFARVDGLKLEDWSAPLP